MFYVKAYTSYLSQREVIYDLGYATKEHVLETDYLVISLSAKDDFNKYADKDKENGFEKLVEFLEGNDYELITEIKDVLVIYKKLWSDKYFME